MSDPSEAGGSGQRLPRDASTLAESTAAEAYCSLCNRSFPIGTVSCPHDGSRLVELAAETDELIGKVLDGRYEIRAPLGKGGMGTVYRGQQLSVDREVAIKVIHPMLASDRTSVKRFLREAKLASRLSQPAIVNVYDFGQSDGVLYLVMELLRGRTLATELGHGRIEPRRAATIGAQLCDALEAAHAQDIVHRDLKPGNIVLLDDPSGRDLIKVLDFGLAKSLEHDTDSRVTNPEAILGTPLYMAPEQIEGKPLDSRGDLYALGCILYELISGAPPFVDPNIATILARHLGDPPAPLASSVPAPLRHLIEKLLAKAPVDRVQTAREVRSVLETLLDGQLRGPTPRPFSVRAPEPASLATAQTIGAAPQSGRAVTSGRGPVATRRWQLAALLAGFAVAVVVVAWSIGSRAGMPATADAEGGDPTQPVASPIDAAFPASRDAPQDSLVDAPVDATASAPADAPPTSRPRRAVDAGEPTVEFYPGRK